MHSKGFDASFKLLKTSGEIGAHFHEIKMPTDSATVCKLVPQPIRFDWPYHDFLSSLVVKAFCLLVGGSIHAIYEVPERHPYAIRNLL